MDSDTTANITFDMSSKGARSVWQVRTVSAHVANCHWVAN
jgi:hypothetical protein|eukprot:COSAG01_NODE_2409_length_7748_cov_518.932148_2_plen_40_part_00